MIKCQVPAHVSLYGCCAKMINFFLSEWPQLIHIVGLLTDHNITPQEKIYNTTHAHHFVYFYEQCHRLNLRYVPRGSGHEPCIRATAEHYSPTFLLTNTEHKEGICSFKATWSRNSIHIRISTKFQLTHILMPLRVSITILFALSLD